MTYFHPEEEFQVGEGDPFGGPGAMRLGVGGSPSSLASITGSVSRPINGSVIRIVTG
jgi:hypothetical protein